MTIALLACPHCGAPLSLAAAARARGDLWSCLHCGALLRVRGDALPVVERLLPPELTAQLRQLVVEGKTAEAKAIATGAGLDSVVVDQLALQIVTSVLFGQRLNAVGFVILFVNALLLAGGALLVEQGFVAGWGLVVLGILVPLPLVRPVLTTFKMALAPSGIATIRRATLVGTRPLARPIDIFAFDVAVAPRDGANAFNATVLVPVRRESVHKAAVGARMVVRFDRGDREWLRFDRLL